MCFVLIHSSYGVKKEVIPGNGNHAHPRISRALKLLYKNLQFIFTLQFLEEFNKQDTC